MALILLIEDNHDIAAMVGEHLEHEGYEVDYAGDGVTGLHLAVTQEFDVIILDLMLPGMDGLDVCRKLRSEAGKSTPLLMLTARDTLEDKVAGLDAGADDYLVKPVEFKELEAVIRSVARRAGGSMEPLWTLDEPAQLLISPRGRTVRLSALETAMVAAFCEGGGAPVSGEALASAMGEGEPARASNRLPAALSRLRKKLEGLDEARLIVSVRGEGYRFGAPLSRRGSAS